MQMLPIHSCQGLQNYYEKVVYSYYCLYSPICSGYTIGKNYSKMVTQKEISDGNLKKSPLMTRGVLRILLDI